MAAPDLATFRRAQNDLVALARRDVERFLGTLDTRNAAATIRALEDFFPALVQQYGDVAAMLAADLYADLRDLSLDGPRGSFSPLLASGTETAQVLAGVGYAAKPLYGANPDPIATASRLTAVADRLIKGQARDTLVDNTVADPAKPRYARVPTGARTCAFCLLLASRGAVYASADTAGDGRKYHHDCDCVPTPIFGELDLARLKRDASYDPDEFLGVYTQAKRDVGSADTSKVLAAIRANEGVR